MAARLTYVVIVNYANPPDTEACLKSLHRLATPDLRVILIENGSPDNSAARIQAWLEAAGGYASPEHDGWLWLPGQAGEQGYSLKFIVNQANLGFAGGCNIGIRLAMADPAMAFVWLLNNDTLVEERSLIAMIERADSDTTIGLCGSTLVYFEPAGVIQACGGWFNIPLGRGGPIGVGRPINDPPTMRDVERKMNYVVGASMLVTRVFIEQVGEMNESFFLYFEELDWALRGNRLGYRLAWAPGSRVIHKEGAAIGSSATNRPSNLAIRYMTASYLRFVYLHRPWLLPVAIPRITLNVIKWLLRGDISAAKAVFSGLRA